MTIVSNPQANLEALSTQPLWLVWSNQHRAWWRAASAGYTIRIDEAGRYCLKEALSICSGGRDPIKTNGGRYTIPAEIPQPSPELIMLMQTWGPKIPVDAEVD